MSSSHLFLGLPIALLVLCLELRSGFHSAAFFSHLSHGHFICLCVLFQQQISARSILSKASAVLLFMYSIQSSSSISNCIHFLIRVFFKCHFTVHIIFRLCALTIVASIISATNFGVVNNTFFFFGLNILLFHFFVFSFSLDNES